MNYLRIAGLIAAAALIVFIGWRVSLSFSQGDVIDEQQRHIESLDAAARRDQKVADEMARFRGQQFDFNQQWQTSLTSKPLTIKVPPHVDPKTGVADPCIQRDAPRYRELFNSAVTGTAGVP